MQELQYPKIKIFVSVTSNWKEYYNLHQTMFLAINKNEDYISYMRDYQLIIYDWMNKYSLSIVLAVIDLGNQEDDPRWKLSLVAAGFSILKNNVPFNETFDNNTL